VSSTSEDDPGDGDGDAQDRVGPGEGTGEGTGSEKPLISLDMVRDDFRMLIRGEGLSLAKLARAHAVMAAMKEAIPARAARRILRELLERGGNDAEALLWALRAHPESRSELALDGRRLFRGVKEQTAKDRERRAVEWLYSRWQADTEDWATHVSSIVASRLPVSATMHVGSFHVSISVDAGQDDGPLLVQLATSRPHYFRDFLAVGNREESSLALFGTVDNSLRLEVYMPPLPSGRVVIHRVRGEFAPLAATIERGSDGYLDSELLPAEFLEDVESIEIPVAKLDQPAIISWYWPTEQ
jgi:hypothetical protein